MIKKKKHHLEGKQPIANKINIPKKDNMDSFNILMVISFFIMSMYVLSSFQILDLSWLQLIQLYCLFIGLGFLIPIKVYRRKLTMSYYEFILFNILSFAPLLIGITFVINNTFSSPTYVETYQIIHFDHDEYKTLYYLNDNKYEDKEYLRSIKQGDEVEVLGSENLSIYFSDGLLGLRIIEKKLLH